jgi:hypothetical protein
MLFAKLFRVLVLGGSVMGAASGCSTTAASTQPAGARTDTERRVRLAQSSPDSDGGTPADDGGGAPGW